MKTAVIIVVMLVLPGIARAQRLPHVALPEHYDLRLEPDLEHERFSGEVNIRVSTLAATDTFVLNAAELMIIEATVAADGMRQAATVALDPAAETLTLRVPREIAPGIAELRIQYTGVLNRDLRGFYISETGGRKYAITQLEATDARRMFPAFDEPAFKATFAMTAIVPQDNDAISNGPVVMISDGPGPGQKTVRFGTTPPMSTYLVALAVGDFECVRDEVGTVPLRVCASPGQRQLMNVAADTARNLLHWFNRYFSIDYPFEKLDLVAIPDFAAGAMENTGAIFFREALLLADEQAPLSVRKRVALVIAHEIAHQWFGDLVTMRWWDDLWLNEGFATWMETKAVEGLRPEWRVADDQLRDTYEAMALDSLQSTRSIRAAAETPAEINELFDPIAYAKAGAVLAMVESYVGRDAFQSGVNAYLERFKYDTATGEDFWRLMSRFTGKQVDEIFESYITLPGVPLVSVEKSCTAGRTAVTLKQDRFPGPDAVGAERWTIPICLESPGRKDDDRQCVVTSKQETRVELPGCAEWVMANDDARGYYRTHYSSAMLDQLEQASGMLGDRERLALAADEWALARAGRGGVNRFLGLAASYAPASQPAGVLEALASRLQFLHEYVASGQDRVAFETWVRQQYSGALKSAVPKSSRNAEEARRTAALSSLVGGIGRSKDVLNDVAAQVRAYLADPSATPIEPGLLATWVNLAATTGDIRLWEEYRSRALEATTPAERYRFLYALASFRDPALLQRTIEFALSPRVRAQDRALLIASVLDNEAGREMAWKAIQANWSALQEGLGAFGGIRQIVEGLSAFCDESHQHQVRAFFQSHPVTTADRTIRQTLNDIDRCIAFRKRAEPALASWLSEPRTRAFEPHPEHIVEP